MLLGAKAYSAVETALMYGARDLTFADGYRQPGVLIAALLLPAVARILVPGSPVGRVADATIFPAAVGLSLFRVGCFLRGCCFGTITMVPLGVRFPAHSPAWVHHHELGFLMGYEDWSLPVHPLQVYLALAIIGSAIIALSARRFRWLWEGEAFVLFVCLAEGAKFFLEFLRAQDARTATTVQTADGIAAVAALLVLASLRLVRSSEQQTTLSATLRGVT
jgi:phosphatidylglycerol:prolipoprotein diacylglycerol transferase